MKITEANMIFCTLLRDLLEQGCYARALWTCAQWDSRDGTERELYEMFRLHGTPGAIEFVRAEQ